MKLKLEKEDNGKWMCGIYRGKGGENSLILARHNLSFIKAILSLLNIRYLWRALTWK